MKLKRFGDGEIVDVKEQAQNQIKKDELQPTGSRKSLIKLKHAYFDQNVQSILNSLDRERSIKSSVLSSNSHADDIDQSRISILDPKLQFQYESRADSCLKKKKSSD